MRLEIKTPSKTHVANWRKIYWESWMPLVHVVPIECQQVSNVTRRECHDSPSLLSIECIFSMENVRMDAQRLKRSPYPLQPLKHCEPCYDTL